jgi:uncharacterized membrane protein YidH (DUF202 family)
MLNIFPQLLDFGLVSPLLLRLALGLVMFFEFNPFIKRNGNKIDNFINSLGMITSLLLIAGMYTQIVATISSLIYLKSIMSQIKRKQITTSSGILSIVLFVVSVSLVFSGAGFYSIDLPL